MSTNNTKQLVKKYNLQLQVMDEANNAITFTHEQAEKYIALKEAAIASLTAASKGLVKIQEEKLYLMERYENMKDFVADTFQFSFRTAQTYMGLEKNFGELGVDYGKFPIAKLQEISSDTAKMTKLLNAKDPESKLIQFVNELKERDEAARIEAMKQKKAIKNGEVKPEMILLDQAVSHLREQLALCKNIVMNPNFDWGNDDNKNEVGKLLEDWKEFMGEIGGVHLIEIERIRAERKPIEDAENAEREAIEEANRRMALPIQDAEISESEDEESEDSDEEDNG